ncbi:response regulator [Candidatus Margulisiibacteriota bacterium]
MTYLSKKVIKNRIHANGHGPKPIINPMVKVIGMSSNNKAVAFGYANGGHVSGDAFDKIVPEGITSYDIIRDLRKKGYMPDEIYGLCNEEAGLNNKKILNTFNYNKPGFKLELDPKFKEITEDIMQIMIRIKAFDNSFAFALSKNLINRAVKKILSEVEFRKKGHIKILIVDDEEIWQNTVQDQLLKMGFSRKNIVMARNPLIAVDVLLKTGFSPDLVMTDNNMPGMEGVAFLHRIRSENLTDLFAQSINNKLFNADK